MRDDTYSAHQIDLKPWVLCTHLKAGMRGYHCSCCDEWLCEWCSDGHEIDYVGAMLHVGDGP